MRLEYTRTEEFRSSRSRHPQILRLRTGARADGTLTAIDLRVISNTGAYGGHARTVMGSTGFRALGMYRAANLRFYADAVYTNLPPAGAFRGYGAPQGYLALECQMDEMAQALGLDPLEFRRRNWVREGDFNPLTLFLGEGAGRPDQRIESCGLAECATRGAAAIGWTAKHNRRPAGAVPPRCRSGHRPPGQRHPWRGHGRCQPQAERRRLVQPARGRDRSWGPAPTRFWLRLQPRCWAQGLTTSSSIRRTPT